MTRVVLNKAAFALACDDERESFKRETRETQSHLSLLKRTTFAALFSFFFFLFGFTFYLIRRIRMMLWKLSKLATNAQTDHFFFSLCSNRTSNLKKKS